MLTLLRLCRKIFRKKQQFTPTQYTHSLIPVVQWVKYQNKFK